MFRLLKDWLKGKLFTEEELDNRIVRHPVQLRGATTEEKLKFWLELAVMFESPAGRAFLSQMQTEFDLLQDSMLAEKDVAVRDGILHQMRQQAYVLSYPKRVQLQVTALHKKANP